jgi:hypothetical protein
MKLIPWLLEAGVSETGTTGTACFGTILLTNASKMQHMFTRCACALPSAMQISSHVMFLANMQRMANNRGATGSTINSKEDRECHLEETRVGVTVLAAWVSRTFTN